MRKCFYTFCFLSLIISCEFNSQKNKSHFKEIRSESAGLNSEIPSYDYNELATLLSKKDDKIYVINFWATWCAPCVKELPFFEKIYSNYKEKNVKVILVSLDFPSQKETRLIPFVNKESLQSEVVLMIDPDQDAWIPKVSEKWSGAIPATLIYNSNKRQFYERSFNYQELNKELQKFLK